MRLASWIWQLVSRRRIDAEVDEELRFHLEEEIRSHVERGVPAAEARRLARLDLGGLTQAHESVRDVRTLWFDDVAHDVRYALRALRKSPAFTLTAVVTLALALGANAVMFGALDAVVIQSFPIKAPEQLEVLFTGLPGPNPQGRSAYLTVEEWRRRSRAFAEFAVLDGTSVTMSDANGAERVGVARVSPNFLPMLGIQPAAGGIFSAEDADARQAVAVVSHRFWQRHFGGSADALGAVITLDGTRTEIIGILPETFDVPRFDSDIWQPHTLFPDWNRLRAARGAGPWVVLGRRSPSVTHGQAQAEMSALARAIDGDAPTGARIQGTTVVPLERYLVDSKSRLAMWMLMGAVLSVLLLAAANVAGLLVARTLARAHELAVRTALGASPGRVTRQLVAEGVTLVGLSALPGALFAAAGVQVIRAFGPRDLPRLDGIALDLRAAGVMCVMSLAAGVFLGLVSAMLVRRRRMSMLEHGRGTSAGPAAQRVRRLLVAAEFAVAIVLMAGAGLLVRSWTNLLHVDAGFESAGVLTLNLQAPVRVPAAQRAAFYADVLDRVASLPGVQSAALIGDLFITNDDEHVITRADQLEAPIGPIRIRLDEASADIFKTLGASLLRGRSFSKDDRPEGPHVAVVNETMARRVWPGEDPIGRQFTIASGGPSFTIVGLVRDMRREGLDLEPIPQMFEPLAQNPSRNELLLVRTAARDPEQMTSAVQAAIRRVDAQTPMYLVNTLDGVRAASLAQRRFQTALLVGFSLISLLLAAIGIYGLVRYTVTTRTREIGIRLAIGAETGDILRMIVREAMQLSLAGLTVGLVGAWLAGHAASGLLFGVSPTDPVVFVATSFMLVLVAAAACCLPARRIAKISPATALRDS